MRRHAPYALLTLFVLAMLASALAAPVALHALDPQEDPQEVPEQQPEVRPQPFPAPPEQPPADRRPDEGQPVEPPPGDVEPYGTEDENAVEVGTETEVEPPEIDTAGEQPDETAADRLNEERGEADGGAWYRDPFWVLAGLVALVVVVILVFSSSRKR